MGRSPTTLSEVEDVAVAVAGGVISAEYIEGIDVPGTACQGGGQGVAAGGATLAGDVERSVVLEIEKLEGVGACCGEAVFVAGAGFVDLGARSCFADSVTGSEVRVIEAGVGVVSEGLVTLRIRSCLRTVDFVGAGGTKSDEVIS